MPAAPRDRPADSTVLGSFSAFISADADAVFAALKRRLEANPAAASFTLVDADERLIVLQGTWWYRGEWHVTIDPAGSDLDHEILNIADRGRWAARLTARRVLRRAQRTFDELAEQLRTEVE
jgi:hypothetical protein